MGSSLSMPHDKCHDEVLVVHCAKWDKMKVDHRMTALDSGFGRMLLFLVLGVSFGFTSAAHGKSASKQNTYLVMPVNKKGLASIRRQLGVNFIRELGQRQKVIRLERYIEVSLDAGYKRRELHLPSAYAPMGKKLGADYVVLVEMKFKNRTMTLHAQLREIQEGGILVEHQVSQKGRQLRRKTGQELVQWVIDQAEAVARMKQEQIAKVREEKKRVAEAAAKKKRLAQAQCLAAVKEKQRRSIAPLPTRDDEAKRKSGKVKKRKAKKRKRKRHQSSPTTADENLNPLLQDPFVLTLRLSLEAQIHSVDNPNGSLSLGKALIGLRAPIYEDVQAAFTARYEGTGAKPQLRKLLIEWVAMQPLRKQQTARLALVAGRFVVPLGLVWRNTEMSRKFALDPLATRALDMNFVSDGLDIYGRLFRGRLYYCGWITRGRELTLNPLEKDLNRQIKKKDGVAFGGRISLRRSDLPELGINLAFEMPDFGKVQQYFIVTDLRWKYRVRRRERHLLSFKGEFIYHGWQEAKLGQSGHLQETGDVPKGLIGGYFQTGYRYRNYFAKARLSLHAEQASTIQEVSGIIGYVFFENHLELRLDYSQINSPDSKAMNLRLVGQL
ncbi:MAG: hypothetical protein VYA34_08080 [Myxococcota bacterium]|nr:hypothetical protein [Myxococcota bacterium]